MKKKCSCKMKSAKKAVGKKVKKAKEGKIAKVMHEWGEGKLHSGSKKGPKVKSQKQALAIGYSEARKGKK